MGVDTSRSLAALYGDRVKRARAAAGLTQAALGALVHVANTRIAQIEGAKGARPPLDLARRLDTVLRADGLLIDLWPHLYREVYPEWSQEYMESEQRAVKILAYAGQSVHGLLQTPEYARAMLRLGKTIRTKEKLEEQVAQRLARQERLVGDDPPILKVILDEAVLRRPVGGPEVMRSQLRALLQAAELPKVKIHVLPFETGEHGAMGGSLHLVTLPDETRIAYTEGADTGTLFREPKLVEPYVTSYDELAAEALPSGMSLTLIRSAMEGKTDARFSRSQLRRLATVQLQQSRGGRVRGGGRRRSGGGAGA
ncbi:Scr1 family TA system antitoxin-like transcriptional regulator [Streptomyces sp. NPDC057638]|uniref:helix-turn-helix domain-containing protein n=1 Tax=Streptomyces sp. NPDC057638 TaxID=3346190 RepID=UPI0036CEE11C